jgi:hypothetical protein
MIPGVNIKMRAGLTDQSHLKTNATGADGLPDPQPFADALNARRLMRSADGDRQIGRDIFRRDMKGLLLAVLFEEGAMPGSAEVEFVRCWLVDHPKLSRSTDGETDHYGEFFTASNELPGTVHRVDQPDSRPVQAAGIVGKFFTENAVIGKQAVQFADNPRAGFAVGGSNGITWRFPFD